MNSQTIKIYKDKLADFTPQEIAFIDEVYKMAENMYQQGGDNIVECIEPKDILADFETLDDAREYCRINKDREDDIRATAW